MSLILKSNTRYKGVGSFPRIEQVKKSTAEFFTEYKERVLADGGVITSEEKVWSAISFLYKNNLIGRMSCCASPYYGVKKDGSGGVLKLYSLDGEDLVSDIFGLGVRPIIDGDGYLVINHQSTFTAEEDALCYVRTENKVTFDNSKQIGHAVVFKSNENGTKYPVIGLSMWDKWTWITDPNIQVSIQNWSSESKVLGETGSPVIGHSHSPEGRGAFVLRVDDNKTVDNFELYNADILFRKNTSTIADGLFKNEFHVVYGGWGGITDSRYNRGMKTLLSCLWFVDDLYSDAAIEVTKFTSKEYV